MNASTSTHIKHEKSLLSIAGLDPSGGAGIMQDSQVFNDFGWHALSVLTAIVPQNTRGVKALHRVECEVVAEQLQTLDDDIDIAGVKVGVMPSVECMDTVQTWLSTHRDRATFPVVVDPILGSGQGQIRRLHSADQARWLSFMCCASVVTPNTIEVAWLLKCPAPTTRREMEDAAKALRDMCGANILLKGGHAEGVQGDVWLDENGAIWYDSPSWYPYEVRGTGCRLSSALAAALARTGGRQGVDEAIDYIRHSWTKYTRVIGRGARVFASSAKRGSTGVL